MTRTACHFCGETPARSTVIGPTPGRVPICGVCIFRWNALRDIGRRIQVWRDAR